jgi:hypothetical protein
VLVKAKLNVSICVTKELVAAFTGVDITFLFANNNVLAIDAIALL